MVSNSEIFTRVLNFRFFYVRHQVTGNKLYGMGSFGFLCASAPLRELFFLGDTNNG